MENYIAQNVRDRSGNPFLSASAKKIAAYSPTLAAPAWGTPKIGLNELMPNNLFRKNHAVIYAHPASCDVVQFPF